MSASGTTGMTLPLTVALTSEKRWLVPVRNDTRPTLGTNASSLNDWGAQSVVGLETCAKPMVRVSEKLPAVVETTVPVERRRPTRPVHSSREVRQVVGA